MSRDNATLLDIARAARLTQEFTVDMTAPEFLADAKTQSAVLHQLMVIGEAVKRLSTKFRQQHAALPWRQIAGMRDHLIHAYDTVDLEEVWRTVRRDIPGLLAYIEPLLPQQDA